MSTDAAAEPAREYWETPEGQAQRREARQRKVAEQLGRSPVSDDVAEAIRDLLPPVRTES